MGLIFKISLRNLLRHKGKSLIIGVILFLGALLMTFGNGVIAGLEKGLEANIINAFLGDIVIISDKEKTDNILMKMYGESVSPINNYKEIKQVLAKQPYLKDFLPAGKNVAWIINEDEGDPGFSNMIGVDLEKYRAFFPDNFYPIEGRLLKKGESGILMPDGGREEIYDRMHIWFIPENETLVEKNVPKSLERNIKNLTVKNNAVFMGFSDGNTTSDIRLSVKGIIKFKALNKIWGHFAFTDIESYRRCLGYFSASDTTQSISKESQDLLSKDSENMDALFNNQNLIVKDKKSQPLAKVDFKKKELSTTEGLDLETGIYNLVFVKIKKGENLKSALDSLNKALKEAKLEVRAISWKSASGTVGNMATIMSGALFFFVIFLFIVAIIIIVNTMTMAALERTPEIGMMRAIGARKSFISKMFIGEISMLSFLFGGIGIITGIALVEIIPGLNITTDNDILQLLYGGDKFQPYLSASNIVFVTLQLALVTVITAIYPIKVAKNIKPLDAISRE